MISKELQEELERLNLAFQGLQIFNDKNQEELEKLKFAFKKYAEEGGQAYYELSKYGWYLNNDSTPGMVFGLMEKLESEGVDSLDKYMTEYYRIEQDSILYRLKNQHPTRTKIFDEAFTAYYEGNYYSSICLLLTQVDGICNDLTKKLFFRNQRNKKHIPEVEEEVRKSSKQILNILSSPLKQSTLINEHTENLCQFPSALNRHAIIHGYNIDYGTELNCLKIISFIGYINDVLNWL